MSYKKIEILFEKYTKKIFFENFSKKRKRLCKQSIKIVYLQQPHIKSIKILTKEKNVGIVKNYNSAVKKANGEYIIGLAADDEFLMKM